MVHVAASRVLHCSRSLAAIAVALLFAAVGADATVAEAEARDGRDWVRVTAQPCSNAAVLMRLPAGPMPLLWQAEVEFRGVRYSPCWHRKGDAIYLLYEDGDLGILPVSNLRRVVVV